MQSTGLKGKFSLVDSPSQHENSYYAKAAEYVGYKYEMDHEKKMKQHEETLVMPTLEVKLYF